MVLETAGVLFFDKKTRLTVRLSTSPTDTLPKEEEEIEKPERKKI